MINIWLYHIRAKFVSVPVSPRIADFFMRCFSSLLPARLTSWAQTPSMGSVKGRFCTLKFTAGS